MKYIYQNEGWPSFTWDKDLISAKLVKANKAAGILEGRLMAIGFDAQQQAVVETLTHDIVASSEIENVVLNSDQVRSSVARRMGVRVTNEVEPSHYVEGVVEMMLDAVTGYDRPLTDERLFGWHNCLFPTGRSGMEVIKAEMSRFLSWFNAADTPRDYVKSAVAHFWFVSIHPFDDGNGRISRAIADMALSQADNSTMRYFSMSRQINKEKRHYNKILEQRQKGGLDITEWIAWYLDCMMRAIKESEIMLTSILNKAVFWQQHAAVVMTDRQKNTLNIWLDGYCGKLTVKNWAKQSGASVDTAARDIKDLVDKGVLTDPGNKLRNIAYGIVISPDTTLWPLDQLDQGTVL